MDLLTNAVESIQVGVEDYKHGSRPRLLSAVRNIHAGILLLYKEALRRKSPPHSNDVLVMAKMVPSRDSDNKVIFVGEGKRTADTLQIKERFQGLGISTDWKRVDRIADVRNDVEHRYPQLAQEALQSVIADSFIIVRDFIAEELDADPRELLGDETWQTMLEVSEVHTKEKRECDSLLAQVDWVSSALKEGLTDLTCANCGSDLLHPNSAGNSYEDVQLQCSSCGETEAPESYVPRAIASALHSAAYQAYKEGGETPYVLCPECCEKAYVVEERRCALCGHEAEHRCTLCGNYILPEELYSSPLCGYCNYMMNKDD
jgi:hypothetical protein